jgi:hypothetical protein
MTEALVNWYWQQTLRVRFLVWWSPVFVAALLVDTFRWHLPLADWEYANVVPFTLWMGIWAWIDHEHAKQSRPDHDPAVTPPV